MNTSKLVGAGAFVVIGLLLFTVGLFMIGERRMLFEDRFVVYTEFAKLGQLELGAVVRVAGMDAGEVTDIVVPRSPAGKFRVKMQVREDLHGIVRTDSVASTQIEGLVGAIFLNIGAGTEKAPTVPDGGTIPSREPFSFADLLDQASSAIALVTTTVESLRGDIDKAVEQIALTAEDAHAMVEDIRPDMTAIARNAGRIAADSQQIAARIRAGEGTIGKLVNDPALYDRAKEIAEDAKTVMANVREVSEDARRAIAEFRSTEGPAQGLLGDMRVTLGQTREAVSDLADNMEALKHNFLLRGYFNRRGYFDLDAIAPAEYRKGILGNGKRKPVRVWLAARVLFEQRPDGSEVLTPDGKARIDSAVAPFLKYLPANPLVVEGYAAGPTNDERFRLARRRAVTVREYLLGRFDLPSSGIGAIALGDEAPGSPEDGKWNGAALAVFLDRDALTEP